MTAKWMGYDNAQIRFLADRAQKEDVHNERTCPVCGQRKVRTYQYFSSRMTGDRRAWHREAA